MLACLVDLKKAYNPLSLRHETN